MQAKLTYYVTTESESYGESGQFADVIARYIQNKMAEYARESCYDATVTKVSHRSGTPGIAHNEAGESALEDMEEYEASNWTDWASEAINADEDASKITGIVTLDTMPRAGHNVWVYGLDDDGSPIRVYRGETPPDVDGMNWGATNWFAVYAAHRVTKAGSYTPYNGDSLWERKANEAMKQQAQYNWQDRR